jgi:hypothetical protein
MMALISLGSPNVGELLHVPLALDDGLRPPTLDNSVSAGLKHCTRYKREKRILRPGWSPKLAPRRIARHDAGGDHGALLAHCPGRQEIPFLPTPCLFIPRERVEGRLPCWPQSLQHVGLEDGTLRGLGQDG